MENVKHTLRIIRIWALVFAVAVFLQSCGPTARIDFESSTDFSAYKTYNWIASIDSGLSEFDNRRIKRAADSILQSRGYLKTNNPDFIVNFYAVEEIMPSQYIGINAGGIGGNVAIGGGGSVPLGGNKLKQTLTLDFVDPDKDELFWQGVAVSKYFATSPAEQRVEHYQKVVDKLMSKFPPQ